MGFPLSEMLIVMVSFGVPVVKYSMEHVVQNGTCLFPFPNLPGVVNGVTSQAKDRNTRC